MTMTSENNLKTLRSQLDALAKRTDQQWIASLNKRKLEELHFHDDDRRVNEKSGIAPEAEAANVKYYKTANLYSSYIKQWIKEHAKGKIFLNMLS